MTTARRFTTATLTLGLALAVTTPALGVGMGKSQIALGQNGEKEAMTPLKLTNNVQGYELDAGKKMVCLRVKVKNVGPKAFEEFVGNGAKLRLKGGVTEQPQITGGGLCKSSGTIKLKPGASISLNLPFELRTTDKIVGFEYTASSGFGSNKPVWSFRG